MEQTVEMKLTGVLSEFVVAQATSGLYESPAEYLRALVRQEYESLVERRWSTFESQLRYGMSASPEVFVDANIEGILAETGFKLGSA